MRGLHVVEFHWKSALVFLVTVALTSCAIRPLPGDYKFPLRTIDIVDHIRCEARHAIASITMREIREFYDALARAKNITPAEQEALEIYRSRLVNFESAVDFYVENDKKFIGTINHPTPENVRSFLDLLRVFALSEVGYGFTFDITEKNDATEGSMDFKFDTPDGILDINLGGEYTRSRQNKRVFAVVETIEDIALDSELRYLDERGPDGKPLERACNEDFFDKSKNYHLPLNGNIKLKDTFDTYVKFVLKFGLGVKMNTMPGSDTPIIEFGKEFKAKDLRDKITFITAVTGSTKPKITLEADIFVGGRLTMASALATNTRTESHELLLILQPSSNKEVRQLIPALKQAIPNLQGELEFERLRKEGDIVTAIPPQFLRPNQ